MISEKNMNIDLVIVTFNRLEKLKKALKCYDEQTGEFRNLIVVNNCSTDGTDVFLAEWQKETSKYHKVVITAKENLGGSGGFYLGQKYALEHDADWVFLADDDAYADKDMVKNFWEFTEKHDCSKYSVVAAEVLSMDGSVCLYHRYRYKVSNLVHFNLTASVKEDYDKECFDFDIVSYVGPFVNGKAMKEVGTVLPQYFIYSDDGEHSLRLAKYGKLICVPAIKITHESGAEKMNANQDIIVSWRDYYRDRNRENMMKRHFPLVAFYKYLHVILLDYPRHHSDPGVKLMKRAVSDGFFNHLGIDPVIKPGWEIKRNE